MKGLSETMVIIITVVVILVAALVLLSIFSGTIGPIGPQVNCQRDCSFAKLQCKAGATGDAPGWTAELKNKCPTLACTCGV